ncbi:hypothetical protein ABIE44_001475 [Marmoricola sp. OAE513]|uniref:DKNYY domain-containing protein n=1 Tax=Marmoricola sp. OAE513 TaxID=2817894 RepID=UPI0033987278
MRPPRAVLLVLAFLVALAGCGDGAPSSLFSSSGYHVRGEKVYYLRAFPGDASRIETADATTFTVLDTTYAKDKNAVYLDGEVLTEADPATFELLDRANYTADASHVFLSGKVLSTDVAHFELIADGLAKDSEKVFWSDGSVLSEDPAGFSTLSSGDGYLYNVDSRTVFVNGNPIEGANPDSFQIVGGAYATDGDDVYYFTDRVRDADARSVKALEGSYARDGDRVFWRGKTIPGADPATFSGAQP